MLLSSTTDLVTADTTSTADVVFIVEYAIGDKTTSPMVIKDADTKVTVSTTIQAALDISGSPAAANDRWQINRLRAINYHASASNSVEIKYKKGAATARRVKKATLLAGETLEMDKNGVWFKYTSEVGVYQAAAIPGTRVVLASGSAATYTTPSGCRAIEGECIAGGGAGGGSSSVAASGGGGGGGGSGGYTKKLFSPPAATYTYTIGAGGTAGAAGANAGNNGADTTFGTLTAKGGTGGAGVVAAAATRALGGAGGGAGSGGDINAPGEPGGIGVNPTAALVASGAGAPSLLGGGANGVIAQGNGVAAGANTGGGGSGGASVSAGAAVAGGPGGSGIIIVTEFY
jgi:hypothetical protein